MYVFSRKIYVFYVLYVAYTFFPENIRIIENTNFFLPDCLFFLHIHILFVFRQNYAYFCVIFYVFLATYLIFTRIFNLKNFPPFII